MATNFSPCKGSYVLNQFPSDVMFGMNGFHVSASGAIQGHHGPLVYNVSNILHDISDPTSKHEGQAGRARVCKNECCIYSLLFCVQLHHADLKGTSLSILYPK